MSMYKNVTSEAVDKYEGYTDSDDEASALANAEEMSTKVFLVLHCFGHQLSTGTSASG